MDEFNNRNLTNIDERNTIDVPNKQSKYITTRKRKELINTESDNEEDNENNKVSKIRNKNEESKEEERVKGLNDPQKYEFNKYNTIDRNQINQSDNIPAKNNTALQEKLKKIFMNRDKVKFQYAKQEIPDNLKYHSDESEVSEDDELRKSKASKKKSPMISSTKKDKDIIYSRQRDSIKGSNRRQISDLKVSNSRNEKKKSDLEDKSPNEFNNEEKINSLTKDDLKYNNSNIKRKISNNKEEEKTKSSKKSSGSKYEKLRGKIRYSNTHSNVKSNQKNSEEIQKEKEEEESTKKEKVKKNILLKVFQNIEKKEEIIEQENNITE